MLTLPNLLTLSRIFAVPLLVLFLWWPEWQLGYALGLALYCAAAITDYFDGMLARSKGTVSKLGIRLLPLVLLFSELGSSLGFINSFPPFSTRN